MDAEEIFSRISAHQVKGLMFHDQMASYYRFLSLDWFAEEHERQFRDEARTYQKLRRHYVRHYNKLLPRTDVSDPQVVPSSWLGYSRQDVDPATKRSAVSDGFTQWVQWETETKALYEESVRQLYETGDVAGAITVKELVEDVSHELMRAEEEKLNLEAVNYDLAVIIEMNR